ncbi:MAG: hypothetical protein B7Z38_01245 [Rhodobacterales bacterium 12-64-8]|nr:MAG: hypothetical protein B7Z38_01245 [Rhodobacterales bacterium 12-64-8]
MARRRFDLRMPEPPAALQDRLAACAVDWKIVVGQRRQRRRPGPGNAQAMNRRYIDRRAGLAGQLSPLGLIRFPADA